MKFVCLVNWRGVTLGPDSRYKSVNVVKDKTRKVSKSDPRRQRSTSWWIVSLLACFNEEDGRI